MKTKIRCLLREFSKDCVYNLWHSHWEMGRRRQEGHAENSGGGGCPQMEPLPAWLVLHCLDCLLIAPRTTHLEVAPPTVDSDISLLIFTLPSDLPTGQSDGGRSSAEVPSSG